MTDLIKKISSHHGVTEQEVQKEIEKAIALATDSKQQTAKDFWSRFPKDSEISLAEIILAIIAEL
ncbi:MAG: hypothetical protein IKM32_01745 [Clostridia bacterium]|nr:hypothetical protein [Clostridia bacterium]